MVRIDGAICNDEITKDFAVNFRKIYDSCDSDQSKSLHDKLILLYVF